MARILLGSYMVRYPLGGMMSWVLQYLVGFQRLGHEIYFVEKSGYANSCFDPIRNRMSDDCSYGTGAVNELLRRFDLSDRWCYVDAGGGYHGLPRTAVEEVFASADLFIDMGTHGAWLDEARGIPTVLIDGEPGFTQMKMTKRRAAGETIPEYHYYYTTGRNIGTPRSSAPTAGREWRHLFHPVVPELFADAPAAPPQAPFTTVMNWQSYEPVEYDGSVFGHKDVEFAKFLDLPARTKVPLEIAVSGRNVPEQSLRAAGWSMRDAHAVTISFDSFVDYIRGSAGEFGVCKSGYVMTSSGWFSDRSAIYLACGRPVLLQDTGFREHLPCGKGLFAVSTIDEAAEAIAEASSDYRQHSSQARIVAREHLAANQVLGAFLRELGVA